MATVLVLTAETQLYDSNFVSLWEGAALLAGDHPYRDFYEWGAPLGAYASAGMQVLVGYRLIGEFLLQWTCIVLGVVIAFRLGQRLCPSVFPLAIMLVITAIILAFTPTYHYSKLFFLPLLVWLSWSYIERPEARRSAIFGAATAVAFLFRHDYGVYAGSAFLLALALARLAERESRRLRSVAGDVAAYGIACGLLVLSWAAVVQANEGLLDFVRMRGTLFQREHQSGFFYMVLAQVNPVATVSAWLASGEAPREATNQSAIWIQQMALLVPLLLLGSAALTVRRARYRLEAVPVDTWLIASAATFLILVDSFLLREAPYVVTVAPMTAALSARFLAARQPVLRICAAAVVALTATAAVMWTRDLPLYRPSEVLASFPGAVDQLFASPPVSATAPLDGNPALSLQYLHDCTAPGDRVLVTGSTPFQVPYYARRPVAGGHLYWHHGWRADAAHEQQLLSLLERQSVPFAFSTTDPILDYLKRYPRIREHLSANYVELEGSGGRLLIDSRRQATGTYGAGRFPCFAGGDRAGAISSGP